MSFLPAAFNLLDYRTVSGVNGPLVILDNVKVALMIIFMSMPFLVS
jgi:hypothetical protein